MSLAIARQEILGSDDVADAKFRDKNLLRVKGNTIVLTKPRELQKLLQRNLGELSTRSLIPALQLKPWAEL